MPSRRVGGWWLGGLAAALLGCGAEEGARVGAGDVFDDVAASDAGSADGGRADATSADAARVDAVATDAVATDAVATDAVATDAVATDAARVDAVATDAARVDAVATDAVATDAVATDAVATDAVATDAVAVLYPATRAQSPMTDAVAAGLRAVAARRRRDDAVVAKVGASNTVNSNFLHCFAGTNVELGGRDALGPTLDFYRAGRVQGASAFTRTSLAATVGWSAWAALQGVPSPLQREVDATDARVAVVMFGTNDIQSQNWHRYGQNLWDIADTLSAQGVVPVFTSIPPRDDSAAADAWVPRYVAIMRGVAQSRQLPFVDLERALRALPGHGLGPDGIHMNALPSGARACALTPTGLGYGFNQRNLLTLEALHRVRQALGGTASDADAASLHLTGAGTAASPFVVPALPFSDTRDTRAGGERRIDRYPGCNSTADESGPEVVYAVTVTEPTPVHAMVITRGATDIDVHYLRGATVDGAACAARDDRVLSRTLTPGTHRFVLDTYAVNGAPRAGEYLFVLVRGEP